MPNVKQTRSKWRKKTENCPKTLHFFKKPKYEKELKISTFKNALSVTATKKDTLKNVGVILK